MSTDPDDPTRRMPPQGPPPGGPPDEELARAELADQVRSLRTWLAVLGALAAVALGLAVWALLTQEEESDAQRGATPASVNQLQERVDELESAVEERAGDETVSQLRSDQQDLTEQVEQLSEQVESGGNTEELQQSIETLNEDVQQLQQRVDELQQKQEQQSGQQQSP